PHRPAGRPPPRSSPPAIRTTSSGSSVRSGTERSSSGSRSTPQRIRPCWTAVLGSAGSRGELGAHAFGAEEAAEIVLPVRRRARVSRSDPQATVLQLHRPPPDRGPPLDLLLVQVGMTADRGREVAVVGEDRRGGSHVERLGPRAQDA